MEFIVKTSESTQNPLAGQKAGLMIKIRRDQHTFRAQDLLPTYSPVFSACAAGARQFLSSFWQHILIKTQGPEDTIPGTFLQKGRNPKSVPSDRGIHTYIPSKDSGYSFEARRQSKLGETLKPSP